MFQCRGIATRRGSSRPSCIAGSLTDTTDLAVTQERLRNAVFLDPLTGLCNRAVFVEELKGSYSGVVGLPLFETAALLARCGVEFWLTARAA